MGRNCNYKDLTGETFGRLEVKSRWICNSKDAEWLCKCQCGNEIIVTTSRLNRKTLTPTQSCGCLARELSKNRWTKHGLRSHPLYQKWMSIKERCEGIRSSWYGYYGGRGIKICQEWKESPEPFINWALANGYRPGLSIDRIDPNGNYEPSNCRWATQKEQANNTRANHMVTIYGEIMTLQQAIDKYSKLPRYLVSNRIRRGWNIERALIEERKYNANTIRGKS